MKPCDDNLDWARAWRGDRNDPRSLSGYQGRSQAQRAVDAATLRRAKANSDGAQSDAYRQQRRIMAKTAPARAAKWRATGPHHCGCGCGAELRMPNFAATYKWPRFVQGHNGVRGS